MVSGVSTSFNITQGPAAKLVFTTNPANSTGGVAIPSALKVQIADAGGNATAGTPAVTLALTAPGAATLTGVKIVTASAGVATFAANSLTVDQAGTYTLTATSGSLTEAESASFTIAVGPIAKLVFNQQPANAIAGEIVGGTTPVAVAIADLGGNVVLTNSTVTLALMPLPALGASLSGAAADAVDGVASFPNFIVNYAATFRLKASTTVNSATITSLQSSPFTVTSSSWSSWALPAQPPSGYTIGSGATVSTVTDTVTGLVWQRANAVDQATHSAAKAVCSALDLGGFAVGTWRLPTYIELLSLVDDTRLQPSINTTAFPNTPYANQPFWTSTPHPPSCWIRSGPSSSSRAPPSRAPPRLALISGVSIERGNWENSDEH